MEKRLEREFEFIRRKMEEAAIRWGMDHPEVHRLSQRLDRLHNQLLYGEREASMEVLRKDRYYRIRRYSHYLREASEDCG